MGSAYRIVDKTQNQATAQAKALAKSFNVPPSVVDDLTHTQQDWGAIAIRLAMAQRLMQTQPETYPSITNGLATIERLRGKNMIWGQIAQELGVQVGSLVRSMSSGMRRARWELRAVRRVAHRPSAVSLLSRGSSQACPS